MISPHVGLRGALIALLMLLVWAGTASAHGAARIAWTACGDVAQCATVKVPRDYSDRKGEKLDIAVVRLPAKDQARRIGSLFVNFGGPGNTAVDKVRDEGQLMFPSLNERFDIVGFDPRGVGLSEPSIDCRVDQETEGAYAQPFTTPENLDVGRLVSHATGYIDSCLRRNPEILPYVSTANVARDLNVLRAAVGDRNLTYLGFSYGTLIGATYASLFPHRYRALALDGALDADQYINRPMETTSERSSAVERGLGRFFQACAANQAACQGFGGDDPWGAFDELVAAANDAPIPAAGPDPRPVDGDDILAAASLVIDVKQLWPLFAQALAAAQAGDGTIFRLGVDKYVYGWLPDGSFDPSSDRSFTISALEQRHPSSIQTFLDAGRHSWGLFDHAWFSSGYAELPWGLYPVKPRGVFRGPFRASASAPTTLVVGTTYDPATPYRWAKNLVAELGNARLLTMRGDGHTAAYNGNSPCIDSAVDAYLIDGTLPAPGTVCPQQVPFEAPPPAPSVGPSTAAASQASWRADLRLVRALR